MSYAEKLSIHYLQPAKTSAGEESFIGVDSHDFSEFELLEAELGKGPPSHEAGATDWLICGLYSRESYAGWLVGINLLHYLSRIIGLTSSRDRYHVLCMLLNERFTREPQRPEPGVRDLLAHFMHDKLVLSEAQGYARSLSGENYFDIRGFDLPDSKRFQSWLIRSLPTAFTPYS